MPFHLVAAPEADQSEQQPTDQTNINTVEPAPIPNNNPGFRAKLQFEVENILYAIGFGESGTFTKVRRKRKVELVGMLLVRGGRKMQIMGTNDLYPIGGIICEEVLLENDHKHNFHANQINGSIVLYHGPHERPVGGSYRYGPNWKTRSVPLSEFMEMMTDGSETDS